MCARPPGLPGKAPPALSLPNIMKTNLDKFSVIGSTHKGNQDYSYIEEFEQGTIMVVSDGCSAGNHTSVGARLMCLIAAKFAQITIRGMDPIGHLDSYMQKACETLLNMPQLALDKRDLLATTMLWHASSETEAAVLQVIGDGYILVEDKIGEANLFEIKAEGNAPEYPVYKTAHYRQALTANFDDFPTFNTTISKFHRGKNGIWDQVVAGPRATFNYLIPDLKSIHLISDGMEQFMEKTTGYRLCVTEIADEILAMKSRHGAFMQRRMNRMLLNFKEHDIEPQDDFTITSLNVEE